MPMIGLPLQQLVGREAVVHEALEIERHHVEMVGVVEPVARTESGGAVGACRIRCHATMMPCGRPGYVNARAEQSAGERLLRALFARSRPFRAVVM